MSDQPRTGVEAVDAIEAIETMLDLAVYRDNGYRFCHYCDEGSHLMDADRHTADCPVPRARAQLTALLTRLASAPPNKETTDA